MNTQRTRADKQEDEGEQREDKGRQERGQGQTSGRTRADKREDEGKQRRSARHRPEAVFVQDGVPLQVEVLQPRTLAQRRQETAHLWNTASRPSATHLHLHQVNIQLS